MKVPGFNWRKKHPRHYMRRVYWLGEAVWIESLFGIKDVIERDGICMPTDSGLRDELTTYRLCR